MTDPSHEQDPHQPDIDAMISDAERLLQDRATQDMVVRRDLMLDMKASADFTRLAINAVQVESHCFDQATLDEVMQLPDIAMHVFTVSEIETAAYGDEVLPHGEMLHRFAGGINGLHTLLSGEIIKNEEFNHDLLVDASRLYNATFGCLAALMPDEETFEQASSDLEFYLAPLTVDVLQFDEDGLAITPERKVTVKELIQESANAVHDEFEAKLKAVLPTHDSNFHFLMTTVMGVNRTVESILRHKKEFTGDSEALADFTQMLRDSEAEGHVKFHRERHFQNMTDETADQVQELIRQYIDAMLAAISQFDTGDSNE